MQTDYDTRFRSGEAIGEFWHARLQGRDPQVHEFIEDFSFALDEEICVFARPFSGDVVGIDTATLGIKRTAEIGRQPLKVVALPQGEIVARDWKTGDLLRGRLASN